MGRSYSSGVAVHEPNFGPDVAVRVAPVPQDDAARARSPRAHVHVSAEVDAHLLFAGAVLLRRRFAAFDDLFGQRRRAFVGFGFGFGSFMARQAASVPESIRRTSNDVLKTSRACLVGSIAALLAPVLPLLFAPHARRPRTESRLDPCADLCDVCTGTEEGCVSAATIGRSCGCTSKEHLQNRQKTSFFQD